MAIVENRIKNELKYKQYSMEIVHGLFKDRIRTNILLQDNLSRE